jgi:hypothetical protein
MRLTFHRVDLVFDTFQLSTHRIHLFFHTRDAVCSTSVTTTAIGTRRSV